MFTAADFTAVVLTLKLATLSTAILMVIGTGLAWKLARTHSWWKQPVSTLVSMPLVLPPTVLGFYLLLLLGPHGSVGRFTQTLGLGALPFTFTGLVVASVIYSLPFVVQPIQNAFETAGRCPLEVAASLRASPWDAFFTIAVPLARPGLLTAAVLGFAHTVGEFGVVLMIGGDIASETKVVSVAIYDHVESLHYANANALAAGMAAFAFLVVLTVNLLNHRLAERGQ